MTDMNEMSFDEELELLIGGDSEKPQLSKDLSEVSTEVLPKDTSPEANATRLKMLRMRERYNEVPPAEPKKTSGLTPEEELEVEREKLRADIREFNPKLSNEEVEQQVKNAIRFSQMRVREAQAGRVDLADPVGVALLNDDSKYRHPGNGTVMTGRELKRIALENYEEHQHQKMLMYQKSEAKQKQEEAINETLEASPNFRSRQVLNAISEAPDLHKNELLAELGGVTLVEVVAALDAKILPIQEKLEAIIEALKEVEARKKDAK